ncbi:MAG: cobalt ECF transporter T component CbiQ [Proteobacteria bacterium]|nr:MAG: cobalt ECF transporter T component CbiQ [Pseudomonadota bacterium]
MTSWRGQRFGRSKNWVDKFDPRARMVATLIFALAVVFSRTLWLPFLGLLLALAFALSASLDFHRTLRRMVAMDMFIVVMVIMLPFTMSGDVMFHVFGFAASKQGLLYAINIGLKANAVVLILLALVGTLEASTLGHTLARLKVPEKLVHLLLFTVRYLDVISREYNRMRKAMKARAFVPKNNLHTWRSFGYLIGMLLVRSLERSERTFAAMKCRGYCGKLYLFDVMQWQLRDSLLLVSVVVFALFGIIFGAYVT